MTTPRHDPLLGTDRVVVDGTNLLRELARRDRGTPQAALIARIRAAIPPAIHVELVFDGAPVKGMRGERIASGLEVIHAGRISADERIRMIVDDARMRHGPAGVAGLLIVSDDGELRASVRTRGGRTSNLAWLIGRLDRPSRTTAATSVGNPPPRRSRPPSGRMPA